MTDWINVHSRSAAVVGPEAIREFFAGTAIAARAGPGQPGSQGIEFSNAAGEVFGTLWIFSGDKARVSNADHAAESPDARPSCNAEWVVEFFRGTTAVHAFQLWYDVDAGGCDRLRSLIRHLCLSCDGITYAEEEGYADTAGDLLTWGFIDWRNRGERRAALYDARTRSWRRFTVELDNPAHREAFRAGRVPDGVTVE